MAARILLVEDESFIRSMMVEYLVAAGFQVDQAANTDDALRCLDDGDYAVLVTDINLPGKINGIELSCRFHAQTPNRPVLLVTARPELLIRAREQGVAATVLPKPFDPDHLVSLVHELSVGSPAPPPL